MKKRKLNPVFDWAHIPSAPTKTEPGYDRTIGDYRRRIAAEEAEAKAKTETEILRVQKESSRIMQECLEVSAPAMTKFWSQPLDRIKSRLHDDAVWDNLFLPTSEETVDSNAIYTAITSFLDDLVFEHGYSLGDISRRRFGLYCASQVNAGVVVNPETLLVMFRRCFDLEIFKSDGDAEFNDNFRAETTVKKLVVPVEPPRRATLRDLESIDTSTREGLRKAQQLSEDLYVEEMLPLATQWVESIQRHFGFTPTPDDLRRVSNWFDVNNLNRLDARNYDLARLWLIKNGYWPERARTAVEALNAETERMDLTRMTHEERRMLNVRAAQAREADLNRFGHSQ